MHGFYFSRVLFQPFCFLAFAWLQPACAQKISAENKVYVFGDFSVGAGSSILSSLDMHFQLLSHHDISIGYRIYRRRALNVPQDYRGDDFLNINPYPYPQEVLDGWTLGYGYVLHPKGKNALSLRYILKVGGLIGTYSQPGNFRKLSGSWSGNYDYDDVAKSSVSLLLQPGLEYSPRAGFGLGLGAYVFTSADLSGIGLYGSLLFGNVSRNRKTLEREKAAAQQRPE